LTNLLNSTGYGFNIRLNNTTLSKLDHLLYIYDIKLYASKKNHILSLLTITENFSNDIGMSFGIDKCKTQSICRGRYENLEYITKKGEIIKKLNKGEFYKYLGINQSNHIQHSIIKENLEKQFYLKETIDFISVIGDRLIAESGDSKSKKFLFERISLAIQRGNATSIRGTFPDSALLSEIFVL
jgi:hypothetical protein